MNRLHDQQLHLAIFRSLNAWGSGPAVIEMDAGKHSSISARQLKNRIIDTASFFSRSGIQRDFLVPLFLENSVDFICAFFGLMHILHQLDN